VDSQGRPLAAQVPLRQASFGALIIGDHGH
jgi:hypothetical protein